MLPPDADPTSALAMIRVVILEWETAEADQVPATGVLAYLMEKLDKSLCRRGSYLPEQWTTAGWEGWPGYNRFTPAHIPDPDTALHRVRTLIRQMQWGQTGGKTLNTLSDELFALVAGMDKLATDEQAIPRKWQATG